MGTDGACGYDDQEQQGDDAGDTVEDAQSDRRGRSWSTIIVRIRCTASRTTYSRVGCDSCLNVYSQPDAVEQRLGVLGRGHGVDCRRWECASEVA